MRFAFASLAISLCSVALAHRSGCHRWHSCPSDRGTYTCGDTGNSSECGVSKKETHPREKVPQAKVDKENKPQVDPKSTTPNPFGL